ncbi:MAG: hypothetical protein ACXU99_09765 [Thermodesulfobacteriota bacterium]
MDNKEKKSNEKIGFPFPFKKFEKMAEMMKNCCPGEGDMTDCCSMMKKMMMQCHEGKEETSQDAEHGLGNGDLKAQS